MRPPRALPGGRLDAQNGALISGRVLTPGSFLNRVLDVPVSIRRADRLPFIALHDFLRRVRPRERPGRLLGAETHTTAELSTSRLLHELATGGGHHVWSPRLDSVRLDRRRDCQAAHARS